MNLQKTNMGDSDMWLLVNYDIMQEYNKSLNYGEKKI